MNNIRIKDFNLGGLADSDLQGVANSLAEMVGCDIHSEPGFLRVNQKLTEESDGTINDFVKAIVPCSDGNTYLFGATTGKIWKRTSGGSYSLEATASPAAGGAGIVGAKEYQGYIYYATESRLGRVQVGSPTTWSGRDDNWATFDNTDSDFHPMVENNQVLYIGDAEYIAQVDAGVFSSEALDVKTPLRAKALGKLSTDLLMGTFVSTIRVDTEIMRWNTWSGSFQVADDIPEIGINSFLSRDNDVLLNAGRKGNIYSFDGYRANVFKRIPGDWDGSKAAQVHPNASVNKFGLPLFGLSNVSGNPAPQGVYSLGRYDRNYPEVLNLEWLISRNTTEGIDIGAIELAGTDMLVSWKEQNTVTMTIADPCLVTMTSHGLSTGDPISFSTDGSLPSGVTAGTVYYILKVDDDSFELYDTAANANSGGATGRVATSGSQSGTHTSTIWGVDVLDTDNKVESAYIVTKAISTVRNEGKSFTVYAGYRELPSGTSIKFYYKEDWASSWTELSSRVDTTRKIVESYEFTPSSEVMQIKVELNASGNDSPEIDEIDIGFN